jgi:uncharacterized SAM-binding protein YcdF (DUF218 family)
MTAINRNMAFSPSIKAIGSRLRAFGRRFALFTGMVFFTILLLAFTTIPFWMYYRLGTATADYSFAPKRIVLLGAGGMPSEANLLRAFTAAELARRYPDAEIEIALPKAPQEPLTGSAIGLLKEELLRRGVSEDRILLEVRGRNTREQALRVFEEIRLADFPIVLVTSPEHMYRSLMAFRKAGFRNVGGTAAFEKALEEELMYRSEKLGGRKLPGPEVGESLQFRYQFWNHLLYQVRCYREYLAIAFYKVKGWI